MSYTTCTYGKFKNLTVISVSIYFISSTKCRTCSYLFTVVTNFRYTHRRKKIKVVLQSVYNSKKHKLKIMGNF